MKDCCYTPNPDFSKLGEVYPGIETLRITEASQIPETMERVFNDNKPYLVDVWIDKAENVMPMIPAGKGISDLLLG
jgi:acetolactate synthase-1/2/3 large subunit